MRQSTDLCISFHISNHPVFFSRLRNQAHIQVCNKPLPPPVRTTQIQCSKRGNKIKELVLGFNIHLSISIFNLQNSSRSQTQSAIYLCTFYGSIYPERTKISCCVFSNFFLKKRTCTHIIIGSADLLSINSIPFKIRKIGTKCIELIWNVYDSSHKFANNIIIT